MNTLQIDSAWNITPSYPVQNWDILISEDLHYVKGRHEEWLERIQKRTGKTREAIEKAIVNVFSSRSLDAVD